MMGDFTSIFKIYIFVGLVLQNERKGVVCVFFYLLFVDQLIVRRIDKLDF